MGNVILNKARMTLSFLISLRCSNAHKAITLMKKKIQFFFIYMEIQRGAAAKSFMRKGCQCLIYEKMSKYLVTYGAAL